MSVEDEGKDLRNFWVLAAHASELQRHGDFVVLPWTVSSELAVTNFGDGIAAWDNRCPHRGARIYTEMAGCRPAPTCAYHGREVKGHTCGLHTHDIAMEEALLLVRHGGQPAAPGVPRMPATPPRVPQFMREMPAGLVLHSTLHLVMDCDWRVAVENALDWEHVPHVHPGSLARLRLGTPATEFQGIHTVDHFTIGDVEMRDRLLALRRVAEKGPTPLGPWDWDAGYIHAHLHPYSCLSSTMGLTYSLQNYFPRADGRTEFIHRLYALAGRPRLASYFDAVARMNAMVFEEDAAICAAVGHTDAFNRLGQRDARIMRFRANLAHTEAPE